ncbi:MAG: hypothetical protein VYD19_04555, partial [Myxococcota bacterium]|nr:hypothetical protein [Myxococcota bacterium]
MHALLSNLRPIHIGLLTLFSLSLFANNRIFRVSADAHFLYLADALWSGSLSLTRSPPHKNDWASYEIVTLKGEGGKDGARLRGFFPHGKGGRFRHLDGHEEQVPKRKIKRRETKYFVSFPPLPALLMLPLFLLFGYKSPDVLFTLLFAALNGALIWSLLGRLSRRPGAERAPPERLWITLLFTLGTAHAWCAVQGRVWYTALVVGLSFHLLYLRFAIDMRRPFLAGCALAAAFATRASLICAALFFYAQLIWPTDPQLSARERWRRAL